MKSVLVYCVNSDFGGAPIHVRNLSIGLRDSVKFTVVFSIEGPISTYLRTFDIDVIILPAHPAPFRFFVHLSFLYKLIRTINPDILHAHSSLAGLYMRLLAALTGKPCIFTIHGWSWRGFNPFISFFVFLIEFAFARLLRSYYICVSSDILYCLNRVFRVPVSRCRLIYNGVPPASPLGYASDASLDRVFSITCLARVCNAKDHITLVKAFELLKFPASLTLCGEGTLDTEFISLIKSTAPLSFNKIVFLGPVSDPMAYLYGASALALISHYEAFPLSLLEAMSCGVPPVASAVGGVPEIITHMFNGILVPRGDFRAVAHGFSLLRDPILSTQISTNALETWKCHYSLDAMLRSTLKFYSDIPTSV